MTTDDDFEKRNFQHAGETLAEVWRDMKIDNYDVSAEYRQPEDSKQDPAEPNQALKEKVCPTCGIYFTSHKGVQMHCRYVHGKPVQDRCETRVRPQPCCQRANEFLCIVHRYETSSEDADWLEDEVDTSGLTIPEPSSSALQMPVMRESEWLANPWTEEQ
ncbi:hypothetical protein EVAR_46656_1 [Eumeta japonica]|uniref:C2H2-type domain-containing protein n=1 Tax=Eumeta variegata TaxID=151549 RepID=A0A4C1Y1Q2_EUMVA|nr:hypothetical protein EVAR_46656_1 [Eumeta japonica]